MSDEPTCRTCDGGRLQLVSRARHGRLASFFGSALVVVAIASLVVWVFGFLDAAANRQLFQDGAFILLVCGWFVSSLLLGIVGAIVSRKESLLACTSCLAVSPALSRDEAEESAVAGTASEPAEYRAEA